ncbi:hypothetical protein JXL19_11015, partial [bacterium]|nr:hypothetical protein [bacterium]
MKNNWLLKVFIFTIGLVLVSFIGYSVTSQAYDCSVKRTGLEITESYQYFETSILANYEFEIKFTITEQGSNTVYIKLVADEDYGKYRVSSDALTFYLGDESSVYSTTKTSYAVLGSSGDNIEIPAIAALFAKAKTNTSDCLSWNSSWFDNDYKWTGTGSAKITRIDISCDKAKIKYIEFWNDAARSGSKHSSSQNFADYSSTDVTSANWAIVSGAPVIVTSDDTLYLRTTAIAQQEYYGTTYYGSYYPYSGYYGSGYYGSYYGGGYYGTQPYYGGSYYGQQPYYGGGSYYGQ